MEFEPVPDTLPPLGVGGVSASGLDHVQMEDWRGLDEETRVLGDSYVQVRNESVLRSWSEPPSHAGILLAQSVIAFREEICFKV